jgi:hypothetical protein
MICAHFSPLADAQEARMRDDSRRTWRPLLVLRRACRTNQRRQPEARCLVVGPLRVRLVLVYGASMAAEAYGMTT